VVVAAGLALAVFSAVVSVAGLVALRLRGPVAPELELLEDELDEDELLELLLLDEEELDELELDEELEDEDEELELLEDELTASVAAAAEIERADMLPAASNALTM
jgi:hypothetical protein